jgi:ABC-type glutathione transport system ATPase component
MSNAVIEIRNLSKIYRDFWGRKKVQAVKSLSMDVQKSLGFWARTVPARRRR